MGRSPIERLKKTVSIQDAVNLKDMKVKGDTVDGDTLDTFITDFHDFKRLVA